MEKISIIVPVYNSEKTLKRCVDSLVNQTYHDIEILLVDDGSIDNSRQIIMEYANRDDRVRCFFQQNHGVSSARNIGLKNMNGCYYTFVDSDDKVDLFFCEKMIKRIVQDDSEMVFCGYCEILNGQKKPVEEPFFDKFANERFFEYLFVKDKRRISGFAWRVLYKNKFNCLFNENLNCFEDTVYLISVLRQVKKISFIKEDLYFYYIPDNFFGKYYNDNFLIVNKVYIDKVNDFLERINSREFIKVFLFSRHMFIIESILINNKKMLKIYKQNDLYCLLCDKYSYRDFKKYYKNSIKEKMKAWLLYHKMYKLYSLLLKVKGKK